MKEISSLNHNTGETRSFDTIEDAIDSEFAERFGTRLIGDRFDGHDLEMGDWITVEGHKASVVYAEVDGEVNVTWFAHDDPRDRECCECGVGRDDAPDCPERAGSAPFIPLYNDGEEILYCRDCCPDDILNDAHTV